MILRKLMFALAPLLLLAAAPASAEVASSASNGFVIHYSFAVAASPDAAYRKFTDVAHWWESEHTYSHEAANLSMDTHPGGCWCEKLPGKGFVRHMEVVYAAPGKALRLSGGLGPLQTMAVSGAMDVQFVAEEDHTRVNFSYAVGGYAPNGLGEYAPVVDGVLATELARFRDFAGARR